jgi:hypothetical protein
MEQICSIESAIHQQLIRARTCSWDKLSDLLRGYAWSQVFAAMDRLTRDDTVTFKHPAPLCYLLSLSAHHAAEARHVMQSRIRTKHITDTLLSKTSPASLYNIILVSFPSRTSRNPSILREALLI